MALSLIEKLDSSAQSNSTKSYRRTFCGNQTKRFTGIDTSSGDLPSLDDSLNSRGDSILHYAASIGDLELLERLISNYSETADINCQNDFGETPLLHAARAGQARAVRLLVQRGADARILSRIRESPLHFLVDFDDQDVQQVSIDLALAGASSHLQTAAAESTCNTLHRMNPTGRGTPAQRAVLAGNALVLRTLLDVEDLAEDNSLRISLSAKRRMLAYAVKLHHADVIEMLVTRMSDLASPDKIRIWDNGRLLSLEELLLFGSVSTNPSSGLNWPERFSRMMRFGKDYMEPLQRCVQLLYAHGYLDQDCRSTVYMAITHSRRDLVSCFIPRLTDYYPSLLNTATTAGHQAVSAYSRPYAQQRHLQYQLPNGSSGTGTRGLEFSPICMEPIWGASLDMEAHRKSSTLAVWAAYSINKAERAIFEDLIRNEGGTALNPGPRLRMAFTSHTVRYLLSIPRYASQLYLRSLQPHENPKTGEKFFNGNLNYFAFYMNSIMLSSYEESSLS
jgi:hypothetical protein